MTRPRRLDPSKVREAYKTSLAGGETTLADLFSAVDGEGEARMLSHMQIADALEALPGVDESGARQILKRLGIEPDEHLDLLGGLQRRELIKATSPDDDASTNPRSARAHSSRRSSRIA